MKQCCIIATFLAISQFQADAFLVPPARGVTKATTSYSRANVASQLHAAPNSKSTVDMEKESKGPVSDNASSSYEDVQQAPQKIKEGTSNAGQKVKDNAKDVGQRAKEFTQDLRPNAAGNDPAKDLVDGAKELGNDLKGVAKNAKDTVKGTANEVKHNAKEAGNAVQGRSSGSGSQIPAVGDDGRETLQFEGATIDRRSGEVVDYPESSTLNREPKAHQEADNKGAPVPDAAKKVVNKATDAVAGAAEKLQADPLKKQR